MLTALAKPLKPSESTVVHRGKILPFETDSTAKVKLTLRGGADYLLGTEGVGVGIWRSVVRRVFAEEARCRRVVVVGATDSGKSTLSTYLLNTALSRGLVVGVIDEDVGQGDLAPPGCIGGKILQEQVFDLRSMEADFFGFVGAISPRGVGAVVLREVEKVRRRVEDAALDFYVVNTDGYVAHEGLLLKAEIIRVVNPDVVVCFEDMGGDRVLYDRLREECDADFVLARRPTYSVKTVADRVRRRMSQYRRFLKGGQRFKVDLRWGGVFFLGRHYRFNVEAGGSKIVKRDDAGNRLIIRVNHPDYVERVKEDGAVTLSLSSLEGMFVGLGSAGEVSRFGVFGEVNRDFTVDVVAETVHGVDTLFLSLVRLRPDMRGEYALPVFTL